MKVRLTVAAQAELVEAFEWYENRRVGLGKRFLSEIESGRNQIEAMPNAWHHLERGARRYRLDTFPYGLIYVIEPDDDAIMIVSVVHLRRRASHWRARLAAFRKDEK